MVKAIGLLALVLALAAAVGAPATAGGVHCAVYRGMAEDFGWLQLHATPGARFVVLAEQADGTYAQVALGVVSADGTRDLAVPHRGPSNNGQPQYRVTFHLPDGGMTFAFATGPSPEDEDRWWLD